MVGVLLMLVATGGAIVAWSAAENTRPIVVAIRDLPSGAIVSDGDVAVRRVRVDDAIYNAAVPGSDLSTVVGRQLAGPVYAQQVLARAQVSSLPAVPAGQVVLTIPVRADNAAGGRVRAGDLVQVLVTSNRGKPESRTAVILPQATVYDAASEDQSAVVSSGSSSDTTTNRSQAPASWVALVVTQDQAIQLANARWNSDLDVALVPGQR
jgi:Flp pilus assembly protein CpaB